MSQIIAGSLAAVTSFLLSAKIGIAGSVIGAAASYVISTLAANIYGTILKASGEKLQEVNPLSDSGKSQENDGDTGDGTGVNRNDPSDENVTDGETDQDDETLVGRFDRASVLGAGNDTRRTRGLGIADVPLPPAAGRIARGTASSSTSGESTYTVSDLRRGRRISPKRMAVIVSVVSGLLGVAITAGVVMLVTGGNGTDTVVRDIVSPSSTSKTTTDETGTQNTPTMPDGTSQQRNDGQGTDNDTQQNGGSGTTGGSSESGSSSSGSSGESSSDSSGTGTTSGSTGSGTTGSGTTGDTSGSTGSGTTSGESGNGTGGSTGSGTTGSGTTGSESGTTSGSTGSSTTGSGGTSN